MTGRHADAVTGTVAAGSGDFVINLGPSHPSGHGMLRLRLTLDGDRITAADPGIGYVHRGAEKLFEARDYRQIIMLANRHDWLGAFASELGVVLAAERLAGIEVPPRAVWARTLLAELNRILSHLAFLSSYPPGLAGQGAPADAAQSAAFGARERMQALLEEVTGGRMHYMFNRVGGLRQELPAGWLSRTAATVAQLRAALPGIGAVVTGDQGFRARTRGTGVLTAGQVRQYGVSGPAARASGVDFDLRRDEPYLAYGELAAQVRVVTRQEGDSLARFECLLAQVAVAADIADACAARLARLPAGPIGARLPKVLRVPEGHAYAWTESPLGINGYYLVSRGGKLPWRLKLRSASFGNVQALSEILPGNRVADLPAILGSLFFVAGDIDR
ncbi:MAG: NADH-quinone oxidoreductase subunit D [Nocardiopsaceae bacterium]|jgi:NADH-quinone oxidoreductase subunit D|nr:NADH-quinone oxidoreductase subunit D [Nocardiopsaceae bacterium]